MDIGCRKFMPQDRVQFGNAAPPAAGRAPAAQSPPAQPATTTVHPKPGPASAKPSGDGSAARRAQAAAAIATAAARSSRSRIIPAERVRPARDSGRIPRGADFRVGTWIFAALLITSFMGGGIWLLHDQQVQLEQQIYSRNRAVLDSLINMQRELSAGKSVGAALSAPLSRPTALAEEAKRELGRFIPAADVRNSDWNLQSASFCELNRYASAQFHFVRNHSRRSMTFVSLPATAWANAKEGTEFKLSAGGCPIAGYIRSASLNCVIGDPSVDSDDVTWLCNKIRAAGPPIDIPPGLLTR